MSDTTKVTVYVGCAEEGEYHDLDLTEAEIEGIRKLAEPVNRIGDASEIGPWIRIPADEE